MARDLKSAIVSQLGHRKVAKFFPRQEEAEEFNTEVIQEFVDLGLRELAETVPFVVEEVNFTSDTDGRISVSPIGLQTARRLKVHAVSAFVNGIYTTLPQSIVRLEDGCAFKGAGWYEEDGLVHLIPTNIVPYGSLFKIKFRVNPTEDELQSVKHKRAVSLFGAASAMEEILVIATRENTTRLEGVPDIRDTAESMQAEITFLRNRALALLDDYQEVV